MPDEKQFRLRLSGNGLNLDKVVPAETANQIVSLVLGTSANQAATETAQGVRANSLQRSPISVREFLLQHEAKRIPEQIATVALYLKNHRNTPVLTRKDLVKAFEDAQEPVPKNLARDLKWTVRIGWVAPKGGLKSTYYLTSAGEAAVGGKFPAEIRKATGVSSGRRRRGKVKGKAKP